LLGSNFQLKKGFKMDVDKEGKLEYKNWSTSSISA